MKEVELWLIENQTTLYQEYDYAIDSFNFTVILKDDNGVLFQKHQAMKIQ